VVGGAGKTPTLLALARMLADMNPHALSRGYGGSEPGPLRVDLSAHLAADVGDEPLLLAKTLPSWVARDRVAGAQAAAKAGAGLVLMDDGFQNPALAKMISLLVIDTVQGFGNGLCLPAGPLREPPVRALARADAVVLIGAGAFRPETVKPVFRAQIAVPAGAPDLRGQTVVAFAGIGRPEKFFETLRAAGAELIAEHPFPDHHVFTNTELDRISASLPEGAVMMTTEKDWVRLPSDWQNRVEALPVELVFQQPETVARFLRGRLGKA